MIKTRTLLTVLLTALLLAAGCSTGDTATSDAGTESSTSSSDAEAAGIRLVTATEGASLQADPPDDLVILDVRTPEEFAGGHLDGAVMIDFYEADFADRLGELDPEVPYLLYCRSGNRSGQTTVIMRDLGFTDVANVDGGIVAWSGAGLQVVNG
jgi:phage shock protein E